MDFPKCDLMFETITTKGFFEIVYRIFNVKIHLHHSHVTGKIYDYAHNFCNWKVKENQLECSCIAHNYFGFDFYFTLKGIWLSCWQTEEINIDGTNLTNINFANIGSQVKFIDTMKYFQVSLAKIASTTTEEEKKKGKKLTLQFLVRHDYFGLVWKVLPEE